MVSFSVAWRTTALAASIALLASPPSLSSQVADALTEHRVAEIQSVGQVAVAPGGEWVAYSVSVPRRPFVDDDGPAWSHLHLLDVASGGFRNPSL